MGAHGWAEPIPFGENKEYEGGSQEVIAGKIFRFTSQKRGIMASHLYITFTSPIKVIAAAS